MGRRRRGKAGQQRQQRRGFPEGEGDQGVSRAFVDGRFREYRRSKAQRPSAGNVDNKARQKQGLIASRGSGPEQPDCTGVAARERADFCNAPRGGLKRGRRGMWRSQITEFGRDGRPAAPDGRPRCAGVPSQPPADLGGAGEVPRRPNRRRAGGRQRHRPACGALRPPKPRHHLVAERFQRSAFEEHRGLARSSGFAEHPPAAADRPFRSRLVDRRPPTAAPRENCSRCSAPMSSTSRRGASRRVWSRAPRGTCARTGGCSSTGRSSATAGIPPSATRCSTPACGRRMRNGACATSAMSRSLRKVPVSSWPRHSRCPPTI